MAIDSQVNVGGLGASHTNGTQPRSGEGAQPEADTANQEPASSHTPGREIHHPQPEPSTTNSPPETKPSAKEKVKTALSSVTLGTPLTSSTRLTPASGRVEPNADVDYVKYESGLSEEERRRREDAARLIQSVWRGHMDRKRVGRIKMQRDARWNDLVKQTGEKTYALQQLDNKNDVVSRWHRAAQAASRLQNGEGVYDPPAHLTEEVPPAELPGKVRKARRATFWGNLSMGAGKERDETAVLPFQSKTLEQQHWLEMIDGKHRYGSNMKYYFRKWREADTQDNFFRWLDRGEGKDLDLEEMPRERLERERIMYLSAEQRLNYLIKVDKDGLLRWARNDELVDTAAGRWKDSGDGTGIIPDDSPSDDEGESPSQAESSQPRSRFGARTPKDQYASTPKTPWAGRGARRTSDSSVGSYSSASYSAGSDLDDNEDTHYVGLDSSRKEEKSWWERKKKRLTPGGMRKELLRKTVRRNTWIYVSDMNMNLFVGIKKSGTFQHSSFLAGGKVTSAGIIVVKHGRVKSLNPLSGHYRSSIEHHRAFIAQLEGRGVDLSHVKMAKSVMSLWGLSKYAEITNKEQNLVLQIKKALHLPHEATEEEKSAQLKENAEREEAEHQERMERVKVAEREREREEPRGQGQDADEEEDQVRRVRREVLYGRQQREENHQRTEDTKRELRPV